MTNQNTDYDLVIIGGGLAGSALGGSMALAGYRVLIIEKELKFRDRVRGEVLLPWGSVEAKELGIYDVLLKTCASEAHRELFFYAGEPTKPRDFRTSTPKGTCTLSFSHPEMQEVLLGRALQSGAEVWRGAALLELRPGSAPGADIEFEGEVRQVKTRLVVGADGRESQLANLLDFERTKDPA